MIKLITVEKFSVFNYDNLSEELKGSFNKSLAQKLTSMVEAIKHDDVLGSIAVDTFVSSNGTSANAATVVGELYSRISGGIQAGSGNQNLFHSALYAITQAWDEIN